MTRGRPSGSAAALLRLLATITALVAGQLVLWQAGSALPALPLDRSVLARTLAEADPLAVATAVLRLAGLAAGAGLLATTALGALGRCCGAARLVAGVDRWTPPSLRRLLDTALGVGLAASIGLGAVPAGAADDGTAATLRRLAGDTPTTTLSRPPEGPATTATTLRRLPDAAPAPPAVVAAETTLRRLPDTRPPPPPPAPPPEASAPPAAVAAPPSPGWREVEVQPGESFWQLAERHEAERLGRPPTEREVGACWQELVAANRDRLAVPGDPDLVFPGQRLLVPCP